jgi:hypothetical protein
MTRIDTVSVNCAVVVGAPKPACIDGMAGMNDDIASGPSAVASTSETINMIEVRTVPTGSYAVGRASASVRALGSRFMVLTGREGPLE